MLGVVYYIVMQISKIIILTDAFKQIAANSWNLEAA